MDHSHGGHEATVLNGWAALDAAVLAILAVAALGYAAGVVAVRSTAGWPVRRTAFWYTGLGCAAAALLGPLAGAAHTSFTAHMAGHLLLGMAAPLLIVAAAPVTLLLRALPVDEGRTLVAVLRSHVVRVLTHPVLAAVLNGGGLWLLYTTDLYSQMHSSAILYGAVHLHVFVAGFVFTAAIVGIDPNPHRASFALRATVLVAFIAAHSILAKWLYAHPPPGTEPTQAQTGAQLMYYGGDVVDVTLIVLLFLGWYRATRPRHTTHAPASRSR
jgi:putative membrane protein